MIKNLKTPTYTGWKLQGRDKINGMDISIENKKGSVRSGTDSNGKKWKTKMNHHYGYIRGSVGVDKDHVDCFIGDNKESKKIFIIHQVDPHNDHKYDEDKVMIGFDSGEDAKKAYQSNYDRNDYFGSMTSMDVDKFKGKIFGDKKGLMIKSSGKIFLLLKTKKAIIVKSSMKKVLLLKARKYKIYCDLDGVLVDFDQGITDLPETINENKSGESLSGMQDLVDHFGIKKVWEFIKDKGDFWEKLNWKSDGKKLWSKIKRHKPVILSSPGQDEEYAKKGKREWIDKNIGNDTKALFVQAKKKQDYADKNSILIDDLGDNIKEWESKGGIGILHNNTNETINKLTEYLRTKP